MVLMSTNSKIEPGAVNGIGHKRTTPGMQGITSTKLGGFVSELRKLAAAADGAAQTFKRIHGEGPDAIKAHLTYLLTGDPVNVFKVRDKGKVVEKFKVTETAEQVKQSVQ